MKYKLGNKVIDIRTGRIAYIAKIYSSKQDTE